jgi:hypothetical protein
VAPSTGAGRYLSVDTLNNRPTAGEVTTARRALDTRLAGAQPSTARFPVRYLNWNFTTGDMAPLSNTTYIARQVPAYDFGVFQLNCQ